VSSSCPSLLARISEGSIMCGDVESVDSAQGILGRPEKRVGTHRWPLLGDCERGKASSAEKDTDSNPRRHGHSGGHVHSQPDDFEIRSASNPSQSMAIYPRGARFSGVEAFDRACLLGLLHYLLDAGTKVFKHHHRSVSPWSPRDRSSRIGCVPGLVQTRDRHPVLRPARHRPHRT
jgi:hypothetical protein